MKHPKPPKLKKPVNKPKLGPEEEDDPYKDFDIFLDDFNAYEAARQQSGSFRTYIDAKGCWRCWWRFHTRNDYSYKVFAKPMATWFNPKSRKKGLYHCGKHSISGEVIIAQAWNTGELIKGHIGFGFKSDDALLDYDSDYFFISSKKGEWYVAQDAVEYFKGADFVSYKKYTVSDCDVDEAWFKTWALHEGAADFESSVEIAREVLKLYGLKDLPEPKDIKATPYPTLAWFKLLPGEELSFQPDSPAVEKNVKEAEDNPDAKKLKEWTEKLEAMYAAKHELLVDGAPLVKKGDFEAAAITLLGLKKAILKHLKQRLAVVEGEAVQRREFWKIGYIPEKASDYPVHYSINLDTVVEYADYPEWITCKERDCPENVNMPKPKA